MAKIIFFSPHSFIWTHAFPEAIVAESLLKSGHEIVYITCGESLSSGCICLSLAGIEPGAFDDRRPQVCHRCTSLANLMRKEMKLPGYSLSSAAEAGDEEKVDSIMAALSPANFTQFTLENVPIGRIAAYEFLVKNKKMNSDFSAEEWKQYYLILKNAVETFYLLKRIFAREKPDYSISYNSLYSVHAVCSYLSREKGITEYFMHSGENLSNRLKAIIMGRASPGQYVREQIKQWTTIRNRPCSKELLSDVTDHFLELLRGKSVFVYSAPKSELHVDVRKHFGILADQKILIATMSSNDEVFAIEFVGERPKAERLFKSQIDWVEALVGWVKTKPEYFLIIRVHPREFPNKRDPVKSEHAGLLQKLLVGFPNNVKVNWPEDGLSVYDLACEADVFLNVWSSVGVEMSLLGLPVVAYIKEGLHYPVDLNYLGETEVQYLAQIEQALKDGWSFERMRRTYRWLALIYGRSQAWIGDSYGGPAEPVVNKNIIQRKFAGGLRRLFPLLPEWQDCQKRAADLKHAETLNQMFTKGMKISLDIVNTQFGPVPTLEQETEYIKIEMARIAKGLWGESHEHGRSNKLYQDFKKFLRDELPATLP